MVRGLHWESGLLGSLPHSGRGERSSGREDWKAELLGSDNHTQLPNDSEAVIHNPAKHRGESPLVLGSIEFMTHRSASEIPLLTLAAFCDFPSQLDSLLQAPGLLGFLLAS